MKPVVKGAIAAAVLVLAAVVALVPRLGQDPGSSQDAGADSQAVAAARQAAQLAPCPRPKPGEGAVPALKGVSATCMADGEPVSLGAALAGRTTLVNVWATWCAPCREELRVLNEYANQRDAVQVLAVQAASGMEGGLRMLAELDVHLPSVHDGKATRGPVRAALDVPRALPASYVVSPDGTVRFVAKPRVLRTVEQVRAAVAEYGGPR